LLGDPLEVRQLKQSLAGRIGGKNTQKLLSEAKRGWYNSQIQSKLGKQGAQKNRAQGTGGFDPKNLEKANEVQKLNPTKYLPLFFCVFYFLQSKKTRSNAEKK
jgi:hypothetical protein